MSALQIRVLGGFEARPPSGAALKLPSRKAEGVLAYLALSPGIPHAREKITSLLWSDRAEPQARGSLRQTLTALRKCLAGNGGEVLHIEGDTIMLDSGIVEVDVALFERLLKDGTVEALERAVELYRGDFLDGSSVRDAAFEEWLHGVRARLRVAAIRAFIKVLANETQAAAWERVITTADRLLALDPLQESGHRALMQAYAAQGERTLAVRQYERCSELLRRELRVEPDAETASLYAEITQQGPAVDVESTSWATRTAGLGESPRSSAKPSVVVLPFDNLSGDPDQCYFSDGITEDIITELSRFRNLDVIARHSAFAVRDVALDVCEVGRRLGVEYVVEGSVRKADDRLRVTAQLIEATSGHHLWSERYDRDFMDIFAVQDEIVGSLVGTLSIRVEDAQLEQAKQKPPENLEAYDFLLRGMECLLLLTQVGDKAARKFFNSALELDPQCARAYSGLARSHFYICSPHAFMVRGAGIAEGEDVRAMEYARRGVALDESDHHTHCILAIGLMCQPAFEEAAHHFDRALTLNPNDADTHAWLAHHRIYFGEPEAGIAAAKAAIRLNPLYPNWYCHTLGEAYFAARQYDEAIATLERAPDSLPATRAWLAAAHAQAGQTNEAREQLDLFYKQGGARWAPTGALDYRVLQSITDTDGGGELDRPLHVGLEFMRSFYLFRRGEDENHFIEALRKAGMPE